MKRGDFLKLEIVQLLGSGHKRWTHIKGGLAKGGRSVDSRGTKNCLRADVRGLEAEHRRPPSFHRAE